MMGSVVAHKHFQIDFIPNGISNSQCKTTKETLEAMSLTRFDYGALAASILLLLVYNVIFFSSLNSRPPKQLALNLKNAEHWVEKHANLSDPSNCVLSIQTFRNTLMVAVFVGGYSLTFAYNVANDYDDSMSQRQKVRTIILAVLLFCSFLCWASVCRHASHLGYMFGTMSYIDKTQIQIPTGQEVDKAIADNQAEDLVESISAKLARDASITGITSATDDIASRDATVTPEQRKKREKMELYIADRKFMKRKAKFMLRQMMVFFR